MLKICSQALGIETEDDIDLLAKYFFKSASIDDSRRGSTSGRGSGLSRGSEESGEEQTEGKEDLLDKAEGIFFNLADNYPLLHVV